MLLDRIAHAETSVELPTASAEKSQKRAFSYRGQRVFIPGRMAWSLVVLKKELRRGWTLKALVWMNARPAG